MDSLLGIVSMVFGTEQFFPHAHTRIKPFDDSINPFIVIFPNDGRKKREECSNPWLPLADLERFFAFLTFSQTKFV